MIQWYLSEPSASWSTNAGDGGAQVLFCHWLVTQLPGGGTWCALQMTVVPQVHDGAMNAAGTATNPAQP